MNNYHCQLNRFVKFFIFLVVSFFIIKYVFNPKVSKYTNINFGFNDVNNKIILTTILLTILFIFLDMYFPTIYYE
jgi:hypothetical protein